MPQRCNAEARVLAVCSYACQIAVHSSIATCNTSETGDGGVLTIQQQSTVSVCGSEFHHNHADSAVVKRHGPRPPPPLTS